MWVFGMRLGIEVKKCSQHKAECLKKFRNLLLLLLFGSIFGGLFSICISETLRHKQM